MKYKEKSKLNKNFTKLTQKRGISLIVLIVTIIVIIILAGVVILTINKNNPIEGAKEAAFKEDIRAFQDDLALTISKEYTENQGQRDNKINADKYTTGGEEDSVYTYIPNFTKKYEGKFIIVNDELKYVKDKVTEKEIEWLKGLGINENSNVPENWKDTIAEVTEDGVPIPKGFTYVTGTKETGTVIKDSLNNEFVWIPATEGDYKKDFSFPNYYGANESNTTDDTLPTGITDEVADVKKYGGFYIARYEAGVPDNQTAIGGTSSNTSNKVGIPVSKQLAIVWTNIDYTNAKASAESMISNEYVQTGLLTGKAWDTTCHWIEDYIITLNTNSSLSDSRYYGNYGNSLEPANVEGYGTKQVAGFSDKWMTKNIYDLAGNVWEWTSEAYSTNRICRGGSYGDVGDRYPVSYRNYGDPSYTGGVVGFRSRLYIK